MAHQISDVSGRAEIAYAGETPWHGLGVRVDGLQTAAQMLRHAGLEWGVGLQPVCRQDGRAVGGFRFTVREDCDVVLGVVTEHYQRAARGWVERVNPLADRDMALWR